MSREYGNECHEKIRKLGEEYVQNHIIKYKINKNQKGFVKEEEKNLDFFTCSISLRNKLC